MLKVDAIENGTVIDHIKAGKGQKVLGLLGIDDKFESRVALVANVASKKLGKKDIVKIENVNVSNELANLIALIAPNASINIIKGSEVSNKFQVSPPKELRGVGACPNPNCITNAELAEKHFNNEEADKYRCHYCERVFVAEELVR